MSKQQFMGVLAFVLALFCSNVMAQQITQEVLRIDTPAATEIRTSLKNRFAQLKPLLESGVLGLARDGRLEIRDAAAIPLDQRQSVNLLVGDDNRDRVALYREIARANGHPEWEADIASTIAGRFIGRAPEGWWVQDENGQWKRK